MLPVVVYDLECYQNYFSAAFLTVESGRVQHFEIMNDQKFGPDQIKIIKMIMANTQVVGFNSTSYDLPMLSLAVKGASTKQLKKLSDDIIVNGVKHWEHQHKMLNAPNHIDLIEVAPGQASLKIYGGRMNAEKMQDLPLAPDSIIDESDVVLMRKYCENDLHTTALLYKTLEPQIKLRESLGAQYGLELRSKSDAQIAEAIIRSEVEAITKEKVKKPGECPGHSFQYTAPDFIKYNSEQLQKALQVVTSALFVVSESGSVTLPNPIADLKISIGQSNYRMGIGGLHSTEKQTAHYTDDDYVLVDRDVASYYPSIILNGGYAPTHLGKAFTKVYRTLVERRLEAKRTGDSVTANSLKITINGSFGKFGSKYSILYSPELLIQTTITGQLSLLLLIEMLEDKGISVVSANTDGVVIKCPRKQIAIMDTIIWEWEARTNFVTEETNYRALFSRDVNNYIALKDKGFKVKGIYSPPNLMKNPATPVVAKAVIKYLSDETPISKTISECKDIREFLSIRTVKGGAVDQEGQRLGKAIRWYYSNSVTEPIRYEKNGNKVPRSEGARALMNLDGEFPSDVDYTWYMNEGRKVLHEIGIEG